jgi:hypothetical protein
MKQKRNILIFIAFIILALAACQPTPQNTPVAEKKDILSNTHAASGANSESSIPKYSTPAKWNEQIDNEGRALNVIVDAAITIPAVEKYPIVKIIPAGFEQEKADDLVRAFVPENTPLYDQEAPFTKSQIEKMVIEAKANLMKAGDPDAGLPTKEELESYIKNLEVMYATAPVKTEDNTTTTKLKLDAETGNSVLYAKCSLGKKDIALINVISSPNADFPSMFSIDNGLLYQPEEGIFPEQAKGLALTKAQAAEKAAALLRKLGFADMIVSRVEIGYNHDTPAETLDGLPQGYIIHCCREVNGIPVLLYELEQGPTNLDYNAKWKDQDITIMMDDTGITSFRLISYGKVGNTLRENAALLPFDEIQRIFKKNIFYKYARLDEYLKGVQDSKPEEGNTMTVSSNVVVDDISLGYITLPQKDKPGEFMLVPAWFFYGYTENLSNDGTKERQYSNSGTATCKMIINAVDGSII